MNINFPKNIAYLIFSASIFSFIVLIFLNTKTSPVGRIIKSEEVGKTSTQVISSLGESNPQMLTGMVKKEEIPEELELGDYWYWLYFEPQALLTENALGYPLYIDKIMVNPPLAEDIYPIDSFLEKPVEIYGYQTWGYAESAVFQILSIKETE